MLNSDELYKMNSTEFAEYVKRKQQKKSSHGKANGKFTVSDSDIIYIDKETGDIVPASDIKTANNKKIIVLHRIIASRDIGKRVKKGERGGYVESQKNVGWLGLSWVYDNSMIYGNAKIHGNASVKDGSIVRGNTEVYGNSLISKKSVISGSAKIMNKAIISNTKVSGKSEIFGETVICDSDIKDTCLYGNLHLNEVRLRGGEYYLNDNMLNNDYKISK